MSAAHAHEPRDQRERAQAFVERGWFPFPVEYGGKRPGVGIKWGTATATVPTAKMLDLWFGRDPMNIGIAARPSRLVILDEDRLGAMLRLCEAYGRPVPLTYRVRTAKGWHWYFDAPEGVEIGNSPGPLKEFGFDVRGGRGDGGYVVAAGSLHATGHIYQAEDDDQDTVELPWWITELLLGPAPVVDATAAASSLSEPHSGLFDERRQFTVAEAQAFVAPAIEELRAAGKGEINEALNRAARMVAHFGDEFWTRAEAERRLMQLQLRPWHDADESGARATIAGAYAAQRRDEQTGARDRAGQLSGWRAELVERGDPFGGGEGEVGEDARAAREAELYEQAVEAEQRKLGIREEALRRHRAEGRDPFRALRGAAFLDDGAELTYLVPRLLYHSSTAKIYGPPGAGKTNLALDVALSAACGVSWRGVQPIEPCVVHFLMAEGEAVNRMRVAAFAHYHEVKPEALDNFVAIPQGVLLTPQGIAEYLELVKADRPGLVFLDTKNAMMDGDENAASDVAVMVRAMRMIRDAGDRTCVVLIDHTGLTDESRGRGSNAVTAAMDTEIRVTKSRRAGAVVYAAEVTRDKASSELEMAGFAFTLWPVDVKRPDGVPAPPVVKWDDALLVREPEVAPGDRRWFEIPTTELPEALQDLDIQGADAARDALRVLLRTDDPQGLTQADVRAALEQDMKARKIGKPYSRATFMRGWALLKPPEEFPDSGYIEQGATKSKWRAKAQLRAD